MSTRHPSRAARARRPILRIALALGLLAGPGTVGGAAWAWSTAVTDTVGQVAFERELVVPPLARSTTDGQGRRVFELTAQQGQSDLGGPGDTETSGYNGDHLGPTLRAERGEEVAVRVNNDLAEPTTVHWHGMHLPPTMDGGPHQPVAPGSTWTPTWRIDQPAATLWYHPHLNEQTAEQVSQGMAGMFILDDPTEAALDLPRDYGVDDLPVIVQDLTLDDQAQLQDDVGRGDQVMVNGTPGAYADVTTERVRLRLVNASVQRVYAFGLDDGSRLTQIASDGGLLPKAHTTTQVRLAPGERAEVVVTMSPGETRVLRSFGPDLADNAILERFTGGDDTLDVLQLRAADTLTPSPSVPSTLVPDIAQEAGDEDAAVRVRSFEMEETSINGQQMDMGRIDTQVMLGDTEIWEVTNAGGGPHSFHVHDVRFRVLSVGGRTPGPELSGLKDTVFLPPGQPVRLLLTFTDYADAHTPYMYHCHMLLHEDEGMMGQFVVLDRP